VHACLVLPADAHPYHVCREIETRVGLRHKQISTTVEHLQRLAGWVGWVGGGWGGEWGGVCVGGGGVDTQGYLDAVVFGRKAWNEAGGQVHAGLLLCGCVSKTNQPNSHHCTASPA
jgi:hypothetical protein